jgi:hypothetical protein
MTRHAAYLCLLLALHGCASGIMRAGVGPRTFDRAPFYTGRISAPGPVGWLPVAYQRGGAQAPNFDPKGGPAMEALLAEMNAFLDSLDPGPRIAPPAQLPGSPPDVRFSCAMDLAGDCIERLADPALPGEPGRSMVLSVDPPERAFSSWLGSALSAAGVGHAMIITLEIAPFWPRQTGLRGNKVVDLGSGHAQELPWLTSLDQPVWVAQLTGVLTDSTGHPIRIGAEGLLAKRTRFLVSAAGGEEPIRDDEIAQLRGSRREDLTGSPLTWQIALRTLVEQLQGG